MSKSLQVSPAFHEKNEGYFINVRIENVCIKMLIDTGASVTILRNDIFENLLSNPKTESVRASLVKATGELSPFYGKAYMKHNIGGKPYEHNIFLADIQNEGILGIDFLKANKSNVMFSKGYIAIHGKKIPCFSLSDEYKNPCCSISMCEDVEIPPESEMIIHCLLLGYLDQSKIGILEPPSRFIEKSGLLVAKSLISLQKEIIPLRVINLNKEACTLYKETIAGVVEPVEELEVERVNTMYPIEHDHTKETPDHLRELLERSCENLNDNQSKRL